MTLAQCSATSSAKPAGSPECQIFGMDLRTNCVTAALVNGTLGYYCDIESHHAGRSCTPSQCRARGDRGRREAGPVRPGGAHSDRGRHRCRLPRSYALSLLALARGSIRPVWRARSGSMAQRPSVQAERPAATSRVWSGRRGASVCSLGQRSGRALSPVSIWDSPRRHGVFAAQLASCGFGGPPAIFEGKYPSCQAFTGQWNESELFEGLASDSRSWNCTSSSTPAALSSIRAGWPNGHPAFRSRRRRRDQAYVDSVSEIRIQSYRQ